MADLTTTERVLLRAYQDLTGEDPQGRRPPFRQIAERVGRPLSTVYGHFRAMRVKGAVTWQSHKPCTLEILVDLGPDRSPAASSTMRRVPDRPADGPRPTFTPSIAGPATTAGSKAGVDDQLEHADARNGGPIAAGKGAVIDADLEQIIAVPGVRAKAGELIAFRVQGQSMTGAEIFPGDLVVVRVDEHVEDGELVAAELQSEITDEHLLTVKRLYMRDERACLMPANPDYPPIGPPFRIVGKVIAVVPADQAPPR